MNIVPILLKILSLFLIIAVGYIANLCGVLTKDGGRLLSKLVISITLPAYMLGSAMNSSNASPTTVLLVVGISFAHYLVMFFISWFWPKLFRVSKPQVGTYRFMLTFANVGFIGFPVVSAVLGSEAIFTATLFNLPFNLLAYTVGVVMVSSSKEVQIGPKLFLTPSVIGGVLAIIIALVPVTWPGVLIDTCQTLGSVTTPAALLIIGSSLAGMPLRQLAGSPRVYAMCFFRLIFMPVLMWLVLRPLIADPIVLGVCVLLSGMPVATNGTMICLTYGGDQQLVSQGTFLTTMLSMVSIPLMAMLLQL